MHFPTLFTLLTTAALATAAAMPDKGKGSSKDDPTKCNDKHPENCVQVSPTPISIAASETQTSSNDDIRIEPTTTFPRLSTTTYTTSYCSVISAVPFTKTSTWYEQVCTQVPRETVRTDYDLQWGCATSTVTAIATMEDRRW